MPARRAKPPRAPRGSCDASLLLRLPSELKRDITRAAKSLGVTPVEWLRQAARDRLSA